MLLTSLLWVVVSLALPIGVLSRTQYSLPTKEYNALYTLYNSTDGKNWKWQPLTSIFGYPWKFTLPPENPCAATYPWQGVTCSTTCETQPCNVIQLALYDHDLNGSIPLSFGNSFTLLNSLYLEENNLQGEIPESLGSLGYQLKELYLNTNKFTSTIPTSLGNLTGLQILHLDQNLLTGTIPNSFQNFKLLTELAIFQNSLSGSIPEEKFLFNNLQELTIFEANNNFFTGTIPESLGNLTSLNSLYLYQNQFTGTVPPSLGNLTFVMDMELYQNYLYGPLPSSLGDLIQLDSISIGQNYLSGTIPSSLGNLHVVRFLEFNVNCLSGTIPFTLGNLTKMIELELNQNDLTGSIPELLGNCSELVLLQLYQNKLTGTIPKSFSNITTLLILVLNNNFLSGTIPLEFGQLTKLQFLDLYQNQLVGTIPNVWSNKSELQLLDIHQNELTGEVPVSLGNINSLLFLGLYENCFTGSIPSSLGDLVLLESLMLNGNQLTGTIPATLGNLTSLVYLYLNQNSLMGSIPLQLGSCNTLEALYVFDNMLTGYISPILGQLTSMKEFDVSQNVLTGTLSETLFATMLQVVTINLNNNAFTGSIPMSLFNSPQLISVILAVNCFSGTLPKTLCHSTKLVQLIGDALHSSSVCSEKALPALPSSGLISKNDVHGHIPKCILQQSSLQTLHLGGNSFSGSIPNVPITPALTELVLSNNQLTGSIPESIWQSNITTLDLSFNRLQGTLPSDMLPAAQLLIQSSFDETNQSAVSMKLQVNQLGGTIPDWLRSLSPGNIDLLEGNLFSCDTDHSDLPANDPQAKTYECGSENTNSGLLVFGVAVVTVSIVAVVYWCYYQTAGIDERLNLLVSYYKYCVENNKIMNMWQQIEITTCVIIGACMTSMIIFGLLSVWFASYADVYIWAISAIYKTGVVPSLVLFFLWVLATFLVICGIVTMTQFLDCRRRDDHKNFEAPLTNSKDISTMKLSKCHTWLWLQHFVAIVANIVIVTVINGSYVYSIVSSLYSSQTLLVLAFCLSLFKCVWNFVLIRGDKVFKDLSDQTLMSLSLFNNLIAPLLAELFVSSDCFLYIVTQAPALIFGYNVYSCQNESGDYLYGEVCSIPILIKQGLGTLETISIIPPFHYSYQCSFSLISSYVSVFIFRYMISAIIEPMILGIIHRYWMSCQPHGWKEKVFNGIIRILPSLWQALLQFQHSLHDKVLLQRYLDTFHLQVIEGSFRRQFVVLLVTDMTMLICFGALFPPLAVVIGLSVLKDVMSIRLALGRYCEIMEAVQDESLKEQMMKVRQSMDEEMLIGRTEIWHGVWYGMVMGTWIWGFVLFDTMASSEGVAMGICVMIAMIACPYVFYSVLKGVTHFMHARDSRKPTDEQCEHEVQNPIRVIAESINHIELLAMTKEHNREIVM